MENKRSQPLTGAQKKYLRGLAHGLKPVVMVGQKGTTASLLKSIEASLTAHELIKIRFIDSKKREQKEKIIDEITITTRCEIAGTIGHTAILYRPHPDPDKRRIQLSRRPSRSMPA